MANNKDFIVKNPIEIGGSTSLTIGDADTSGSRVAGYDLSAASYDSVSFSFGSQETDPRAVGFDSTGTTMIVGGGGSSGSNSVYQYTLSTAWDVSTASYASKAFNAEVNGEGNPTNYYFKADGTKFYMVGIDTDRVYEFDMSTAWDLSTASYTTNQNFNPSLGNLQGVAFKSDGTKMYLVAQTGYTIHQYSLSTAWDVTTASADSVTFAAGTAKVGMWFNPTGTLLWMANLNPDEVIEYNLSTAWDISTATASGTTFDVSGQDGQIHSVAVKTDGTKMYVVGNDNNRVFQYSISTSITTGTFDLSTGSYFTDTPSADVEYTFSNAGDVQAFQLEVTGNNAGFDISSASYESKTFSFSSQDIVPRQIYIRDNGLDMYMVGANNDNVFQYTLSTAWDISTASYASKTFSVSSEENNPSGISFKSDGTKMYISGATGDDISQYSLSTAWDITTASFDNVTAGSGQDTGVSGVFFKYDGTKFYMMGQADTDINEFNMSTAWDISTASFNQKSSSISSYEGAPWNLYFSTDGTKVFVIGTTGDEVNEFSLSTAWDISTLSHVRVFSVSSQETNPSGIFFKDDGTKMYITGYTGDAVYQYDTSTPITVTWNSTIEWAGGTAPTSPLNGEKDIYSFVTDNGGTSYIGNFTGNAFS